MNVVRERFTTEELIIFDRLEPDRMPRHVAMIMDGNGRWAQQQNLPRVFGHHAGVESVRAAITTCRDLGVEYLTLYSFSVENWSRPESEVHALMGLIEHQLRTEMEGLYASGILVRHLGRREGLPKSLLQILDDAGQRTVQHPTLTVIFAINYSGRAELADAARRLAAQAVAGEVDLRHVDDEVLSNCLYLPEVPTPDLLIRTGGEMRVSNFLLWQIAYTEFWFTPVLWPEFRALHLLQAIEDYQHRQRKFGRVAS